MGAADRAKKALGLNPVLVGALDEAATAATAEPSPSAPTPRADLPGVHVSDSYVRVGSLLEGGSSLVFVSGNAGSGKTTLIRYLRDTLSLRSVVLAPTGVAALNAGGATIHSFFHFPPRMQDPKDLRAPSDRKLFQKLELLVIDEVSMLRCDLLDGIDVVLRACRGSDRPFGGVQLLFIGDLFQLPPVVPRDEWEILRARGYASPYFFSAFSMREMPLVHVELDHVYRQTDPAFVSVLNRLRVAEDTEVVVEELNDRCHRADDAERELTLACTNRVADQLNARAMASLETREYVLRGTIEGRLKLDKDRLPSPLELRLKVGAQVMFTRNDEQQRWVNGSLGVVRDVTDDAVVVQLAGDGRGGHEVLPVSWETYEYALDAAEEHIVAYKVGEYRQYPLMLAWAVTIHKSQGKTLDSIQVDFGSGAFAPGQAYVALSRCRSLEGIRLSRPLRVTDVMCDPRIRRFYEALAAGQA